MGESKYLVESVVSFWVRWGSVGEGSTYPRSNTRQFIFNLVGDSVGDLGRDSYHDGTYLV